MTGRASDYPDRLGWAAPTCGGAAMAEDHAEIARQLLAGSESWQNPDSDPLRHADIHAKLAIAEQLRRIADAMTPTPPVGTPDPAPVGMEGMTRPVEGPPPPRAPLDIPVYLPGVE